MLFEETEAFNPQFSGIYHTKTCAIESRVKLYHNKQVVLAYNRLALLIPVWTLQHGDFNFVVKTLDQMVMHTSPGANDFIAAL